MLPNPSTPVSFRHMQTVHDLVQVAETASAGTLDRLALGFAPGRPDARVRAGLERLIHHEGGRVAAGDPEDLYWPLLVGAARPEDDFEGFVTATAILLADRLQGGLGTDDLYWHWDAFLPHYRLAPPPVHAVLIQGFLRCHEAGLVVLDPLPAARDRLSVPEDRVRDRLGALAALSPGGGSALPGPETPGFAPQLAHQMVAAFEGPAPGARMATLWARHDRAICALRPPARTVLLAAVRYCYEMGAEFAPEAASGDLPRPIPLTFSA